jgi:hypothetical protein
VTILDALDDANLLGAAFPDAESWTAWRAFLAACFGLAMDAQGLVLYRTHTGRQTPPQKPAREAWLVVGRRGGKSRVAALVAVYLACFRSYADVLAPGERGTLPIIAADRRQARTVMRYIVGLIEGCPMLARMVANRTADSIELTNGVSIEVHTASFRSIRGYTVVAAVLDEIAFWRTDDSANPDREIVAALRPAMSTVPGALLIGISSPYARRGVLWDMHRRHFGHDGDVLVWQAPTRAMNPTVDERVITEAYEADEASAAAEYGAEFRRDIESFIAREVIDSATVPGRVGLPPVRGVRYFGFVDPSGGGQDSFTLAVAHVEERQGQRIAVLDYVSERRPPFSPEQVAAEYAEALKSYRVTTVQSDRYAGQWPVEVFARHGVTVEQSAAAKSDLYRELLPLLNSGRVELLDHPRLQMQLLGLERRTARGGRDSIDHPPNGHDDVVNAAAGALVTASTVPGELPFITAMRRIAREDAEREAAAPVTPGTEVYIRHLCGSCLREWREPDGPAVNQIFHATCPTCLNPPASPW